MKNKKTKNYFEREFKLTHLGDGDWLDEPDVMEFEYKGIKCLIARVYKREPYAKEETWFGGHLCGYIFLPKDHPLYGKGMGDLDLSCHGGITCTEGTEEGWLIGFDCAHSMDLVPSMVQLRKRYPMPDVFPIPENMKDHPLFNPVYRNMDFVIREVKSLAKQATKMMVQA